MLEIYSICILQISNCFQYIQYIQFLIEYIICKANIDKGRKY